MKSQKPRSKEWQEHLDRFGAEFDTQGRFELGSNDSGSVPGHQEVVHDSAVHDGHDYRHLANAYRDMGLEDDEPNTKTQKSTLERVAKTARGRLQQYIADEFLSNSQMNPEEALIELEEDKSAVEVQEVDNGAMSVFKGQELIDAEIAQTRKELQRWEEFANEIAEKAEIEKPTSESVEGGILLPFQRNPNTQQNKANFDAKTVRTPGDRQIRAKKINQQRRSGRSAA